MTIFYYLTAGATALILSISTAWASGMVPETSIVIVEQADGEGAINVLNTDKTPLLLITSVLNVEDDNITPLLAVTPPAARVEPGKNQRVRFILTDKTPLKTERLGRVTFEGVPPQKKGGNQVNMSIRQNLPLLIRPASLVKDESPWKRLVWKQNGNKLTVSNDSPYVVRLNQSVTTQPNNITWTLPQTYILPGKSYTVSPDGGKTADTASTVRIAPATTWGFSDKPYDAPVTR